MFDERVPCASGTRGLVYSTDTVPFGIYFHFSRCQLMAPLRPWVAEKHQSQEASLMPLGLCVPPHHRGCGCQGDVYPAVLAVFESPCRRPPVPCPVHPAAFSATSQCPPGSLTLRLRTSTGASASFARPTRPILCAAHSAGSACKALFAGATAC
ncbi:hypothetical protein MRB53_038079 [Persea americana]|nr:hypothetical protein MRB53_038079 [Persea americana]